LVIYVISGAIRLEQVMNIDEPVVCQVKRKFLAGICIDSS
jgi:hypothetical protein